MLQTYNLVNILGQAYSSIKDTQCGGFRRENFLNYKYEKVQKILA